MFWVLLASIVECSTIKHKLPMIIFHSSYTVRQNPPVKASARLLLPISVMAQGMYIIELQIKLNFLHCSFYNHTNNLMCKYRSKSGNMLDFIGTLSAHACYP